MKQEPRMLTKWDKNIRRKSEPMKVSFIENEISALLELYLPFQEVCLLPNLFKLHVICHVGPSDDSALQK